MQPPGLMPGEEGAAMGRAWGVRTYWGVHGEGAKAAPWWSCMGLGPGQQAG